MADMDKEILEECFPGLDLRKKYKYFPTSAQTFDLVPDDNDELEIHDEVPAERIMQDISCSLYEGFKPEIFEPFIVLEKTMTRLKDEPTILKEVLREGRGPQLTAEHSAKVLYQLFAEDQPKPYDTSFREGGGPANFLLGDGPFPGFSLCLASMRVHEVAHFIIPPALAFAEYGLFQFVPENSKIYAQIQVLDARTLDQVKEGEESAETEVSGVLQLKIAGNDAFKAKKYEYSIKSYQKALAIIGRSIATGDWEELSNLALTINVNLAMAFEKAGTPEKAIERLVLVLRARPNHTKALLHLGRCYRMNGEYAKAMKALKKGEQLSSHTGEFFSEIEKLNKAMTESFGGEKSLLKF